MSKVQVIRVYGKQIESFVAVVVDGIHKDTQHGVSEFTVYQILKSVCQDVQLCSSMTRTEFAKFLKQMTKVQKIVQMFARVETQDGIYRVHLNGVVKRWCDLGSTWNVLPNDEPLYEEIQKAGLEVLAR